MTALTVMDQSLYFVDLTAALLWRYDPASETFAKWKMPSMTGSLALREGGGAIVALQDGLHRFSFHNNTTALICNPQPDERTQFNDGKVGPPRDASGGGLFVVGGLGVRGLPEPRFAG